MDKLIKPDIIEIFKLIKLEMDENRDRLVLLDSAMGDGDLGLSMQEGFTKVCDGLSRFDNESNIGMVIVKSGFTMAGAAPSTMGTLVATGIMKAGEIVKGKDVIGLEDILKMLKAAIEGIENRGKAQRGEKTVLDSLYGAKDELEKAVDIKMSLAEAIGAAYNGALMEVENTKSMKAIHGRAAYYGDASIGHQDPGATVGMLIFKGMYEYLKEI